MRVLGHSSIDEMVLAFLRAEASGPRWTSMFPTLERRLLEQPNLTSSAENTARADALATYRGDVRTGTGFFQRLPVDTSWERWSLHPSELGDVRYANHVTWQRLSGGSRRVRDGAANVERIQVYENGHDINAGVRACAHVIDAGEPMAALIAVADNSDGRDLVLMEGHTRATAYLIATDPPTDVTLLVGRSSAMADWPWFVTLPAAMRRRDT